MLILRVSSNILVTVSNIERANLPLPCLELPMLLFEGAMTKLLSMSI